MKLTAAELSLYSTTRLLVRNSDGGHDVGTGFFYLLPFENGPTVPLLVTNRHVLEGGSEVHLTVHVGTGDPAVPSGIVVNWSLDPSERIDHPSEDLSAIPVGSIMFEMEKVGKEPFIPFISPVHIPTPEVWENFDAIEKVVMVGCPDGLFDETNSVPIFRHGYTATALSKQWNGAPHFMVDMACFPGSSGSPVFLMDTGPYFDRKAGGMVMGSRGRFHFLGVLSEGPVFTTTGQVILSSRPHVEMGTMMHLGIVIRATEVVALGEVVKAAVMALGGPTIPRLGAT